MFYILLLYYKKIDIKKRTHVFLAFYRTAWLGDYYFFFLFFGKFVTVEILNRWNLTSHLKSH